MNFQKHNFGYPISYGDNTEENGKRLSDQFVAMVKTRKFNDICSAIISLVFIIGTQSKIVHAIPPETGEHVANLADAAVKTGEAASLQAETCGHIAGHAANGAGPALPNLPNGQGGIPPVGELGTANLKAPGMPGGPGGPPAPGKPPIKFAIA